MLLDFSLRVNFSLTFYKETHGKWAEERLIVDPDI